MNSILKEEVYNANALIESYETIKKPIKNKTEVINYGNNLLIEISKTIDDYEKGKINFKSGNEFNLRERGKIRHITTTPFVDRVPIHAFCVALLKRIKPLIIYDNCASLKGRGVDKLRDRVKVFLRKYYIENGTNEGYILQGDFTKYFDNMIHSLIIEVFRKPLQNDEESIEYLRAILKKFQVDVSYMSDEEYSNCLNEVYNALEYYNTIPKSLQTGQKYMEKSANIGDEISQIFGIYFPNSLDTLIKIVNGCKYYGRFNDDFIVIHKDKDFLVDLLKQIEKECKALGLHLNQKKTHISKLKTFTFLKVKYTLTDTGKVIMKLTPSRFSTERRKLKAFKKKLENGEMTYREIEQQYKSWRGSVTRKKNKNSKHGKPIYQNWKSVHDCDKLFNELFIKDWLGGIFDGKMDYKSLKQYCR